MHAFHVLSRFFSVLTLCVGVSIGLQAQADVQLANDSNLGSILTDSAGNTLYYFTRDTGPNSSACMGGCVDAWPIFYVDTPSLGEGLDSADFGSFMRADSIMQSTYKGWPLYYYVSDTIPGETNGEGRGNVWFVAKPDYSIMLMDNQLLGLDSVLYTGDYEPGEEVIQYFVDEEGRTLYAFIRDTYQDNNFTREDFSNDPVWPIYEEELQSIPSTLSDSLFGSIDVFGRQQLTYKGWPIYYYMQDSLRGQNTGVSVPRPGVWPVVVQDIAEAPMINIELREDSTLGQILTDSAGNTLYYFTRDTGPNSSACMGGCVDAWPIYYEEVPVVGEGLSASDFGSFMRDDSIMQSTYKGWPLYYYVSDTIPGETNGEGRGNVWFVAKPDYSIMLMDNQLLGLDSVLYTGDYEPGEEVIQYFVDEEGRTLYAFIRDTYQDNNFTREDFSNDPVWPIYEEELQSIPSTLSDSLFGSIDVFGRQQLTYKGWPIYYYMQDSLRGQNTGVSVPRPGVWPVVVQDIEEAPMVDVKLSPTASLGEVLTDGVGNTLYYFTRDTDPNTSACAGGCANAWPIFYAENPALGPGLDSADFGAFIREDSIMQSTYKGWPLYYFVNDTIPGETNGEAVNNVWFVAKADYTIMLMDNQLVGLDSVEYTGTYEPGQEVIQYFVDAYGRTLYVFVVDSFNTNNFTAEDFSNNAVWPIFEEELQHIPSTLQDSLFGSIDVFGRQQLTYKGWPLYYFGQDSLRGENKGVSVPQPGIWPVAVADLESLLPTSTREIGELSDWNVYPNPFSSSLSVDIELHQATDLTINLLNGQGQIVENLWKGRANGLKQTLTFNTLENLAPGLYFLSILDNSGGIATKLILKNF